MRLTEYTTEGIITAAPSIAPVTLAIGGPILVVTIYILETVTIILISKTTVTVIMASTSVVFAVNSTASNFEPLRFYHFQSI